MVGLSPVFIYYSANFLNVIPCLGQTMVGLAFYFSYLQTNDRKSWWWAIVILGITPLIRTTYVIPLIAVLCTEGLRWLTKQLTFRDFLKQFGGIAIFIGFLAVWFVWNNKMIEKHNTIFLNGLAYVGSWSEIKVLLVQIYDIWNGHYFNTKFVIIYCCILVIGLVINRKKLRSNELAFTVILSLGYILFLIAMIRQFRDHDYYFLDTLFLPLILLPIVIWKDYQFIGRFPIISAILAYVFLSLYKQNATDYMAWRYNLEYMDPNRANYEVYEGVQMCLEKNGIMYNEPIFIISNMAPNLNLMHVRHNGVIARNFAEQLFEQAKQKGFNYFLIAKTEVGEEFKPILKELKVIDKCGDVLVMTYNTEGEVWSLEAFKSY